MVVGVDVPGMPIRWLVEWRIETACYQLRVRFEKMTERPLQGQDMVGGLNVEHTRIGFLAESMCDCP